MVVRKDYYLIYQVATSIEIAIFKRVGVKCALTLLNEKHLSPSTHIATSNDIHLFYFHHLLDATLYGWCVCCRYQDCIEWIDDPKYFSRMLLLLHN